MKKVYFLIFSLIIISCENTQKNKIMPLVTIDKKAFGRTLDGVDIDQYILKNRNGMEISAINYGGIITSWKAKDREGNYKDIVLGFNKLSEYETESPYFGAIIGRYGNRIAKGKFTLNGEKYTLAVNNGKNHLHGGLKGFDKVVWDSKEVVEDMTASLVLSYVSNDMEEGYPGNLEVQVIYTLNNNDELSVKYEAVSDKTTIINLTQHSYFNLSADFNKNILDHDILINADSFLPVDSILIPTGEIRNVGDTPFDFRRPKNVGEEISNSNTQLMIGNGYDHCWVFNNNDQGLRFAASAYDSGTGRLLEIFSDQPGIQFYSGNFLDGTLKSKIDGTYDFRSGFCLETQHYPNSPNEKNFPSVILKPGKKYFSQTIFKFSVK